VTEVVHQRNSRIFVQINHCGRAAFTLTNGGLKTWAPSALPIRDHHVWMKIPHEVPHPMTLDEIKFTQEEWRTSVKLAK
jgi:2,4-dienoyl-CoA reductase-like NADH-dependent reductase (Old Yellow Enzyme family)